MEASRGFVKGCGPMTNRRPGVTAGQSRLLSRIPVPVAPHPHHR